MQISRFFRTTFPLHLRQEKEKEEASRVKVAVVKGVDQQK
jgi:hypothetical protein